MTGHRARNPLVRCAVSLSGRLTCGKSQPGSLTVTISATSVTQASRPSSFQIARGFCDPLHLCHPARLVNQGAAQRNQNHIQHDLRSIDRGIPNCQIGHHHDCGPRFTERSSSMTPGWKLATSISGIGVPTSKDRELPLFVGSMLSHWDALHVGCRSAQPSSRVSDPLTARLAMISQGLSNKRIARILEISPETSKPSAGSTAMVLVILDRTARLAPDF